MIQTDARGGGLVNLAIQASPDSVEAVTVPVKAIEVKWCPNCATPQFELQGSETTIHGTLTISKEHWQMSPCLKAAKRAK